MGDKSPESVCLWVRHRQTHCPLMWSVRDWSLFMASGDMHSRPWKKFAQRVIWLFPPLVINEQTCSQQLSDSLYLWAWWKNVGPKGLKGVPHSLSCLSCANFQLFHVSYNLQVTKIGTYVACCVWQVVLRPSLNKPGQTVKATQDWLSRIWRRIIITGPWYCLNILQDRSQQYEEYLKV